MNDIDHADSIHRRIRATRSATLWDSLLAEWVVGSLHSREVLCRFYLDSLELDLSDDERHTEHVDTRSWMFQQLSDAERATFPR